MSDFAVRDRRTAPWCWQSRLALDRIRAALAKTDEEESTVATGLAVYLALAYRTNTNEQCWDKMPAIGLLAGTSEATARRRIADLELMGLIEVTSCLGARGSTSNTYTLLDPPADPLPSNWRALPPPYRDMIRLEIAGRTPLRSSSPAHRNGLNGAKPSHHDRANPITVTAPGSHQVQTRPIMVTAPLKELTRINEQEPSNDASQLNWNNLPPPLHTVSAHGTRMPAKMLWQAVLDSVKKLLTYNNLQELAVCYLALVDGSLVAVATDRRSARSLQTRVEPLIKQAVAEIIDPDLVFSFYLGGH